MGERRGVGAVRVPCQGEQQKRGGQPVVFEADGTDIREVSPNADELVGKYDQSTGQITWTVKTIIMVMRTIRTRVSTMMIIFHGEGTKAGDTDSGGHHASKQPSTQ